MRRIAYPLIILAGTLIASCEPEVAQWRGPGRDGKYPARNLLKEWPEGGPRKIWSFDGIGSGMGSPVVARNRIYVTGIPDTLAGTGRLTVLDLQGNLLWRKDYGADFTALFAGARSTPLVVGRLVYLESGNGKIYCLNANTGEEVWSADFFEDFQADSVQFGFSESLLADGDRLFCTPGGKTNNMVALDRFTGKKIWASEGYGEQATYSSPVIFNHYGRKIIVNLTASSILCIDAENGSLLWRIHQFQDNKIHANTPVYDEGKVLIASASRKDSSGLVMLELSSDGTDAKILWRNKSVINLSGGAIVKDSSVYMSAYIQPRWYCIDKKTGEIRHTSTELGGGVILYADGMFYIYTERNGEIALVDASPEYFRVKGKITLPLSPAEHWAHPVISHGMLLVRNGNSLMAFDITDN